MDVLFETMVSLQEHVSCEKLKEQLSAYLPVANTVAFSSNDISLFSAQVLSFWRCASSSFSEWRKAARILFAMSPNSASCERVFALLQSMYGEQQDAALADHLQASLMMRYNGRSIAHS